MSVLADDCERFTASYIRGLRVDVQVLEFHNPPSEAWAAANIGKGLRLTWEEPYGNGWTTKHLNLPVGRVITELLSDPEAAEVVLTAAAAHLIGLLRESRE